jgi:Chlorophyll A-B binding protein
MQVGGDRSSESLFFPTFQSLGYLDGTHAGDFGFDPLGLSDPEGAGGFIDPDWLRYAEARAAPAASRSTFLLRHVLFCSVGLVGGDCRAVQRVVGSMRARL